MVMADDFPALNSGVTIPFLHFNNRANCEHSTDLVLLVGLARVHGCMIRFILPQHLEGIKDNAGNSSDPAPFKINNGIHLESSANINICCRLEPLRHLLYLTKQNGLRVLAFFCSRNILKDNPDLRFNSRGLGYLE